MLSSRLRTLNWFLRRPQLFPHFAYLAWDRLTRPPEPDSGAEAEAWCRQRAVTTEKAIELLTGSPPEKAVEQLFPEVFRRAIEIERSCPEWMGGPGDLSLLYTLVRRSGAERVIETGVAYGWSSLAILLALDDRPEARLVSSDMPYVQANNDAHVGCVVYDERWRKKWKLVRLSDRQVLPAALRELGGVDLVHYDSDKSYRGRSWAYSLLWPALRKGGFFISDDVSDNTGFRDFCLRTGVEPVVVLVSNERHTKYVGVIPK